jgi:hypothetical protein
MSAHIRLRGARRMETREEKLRELAKEIWSVAGTPTEARCLRIAEFVLKMLEERDEEIARLKYTVSALEE